MPITSSAKKALRQDRRRTIVNRVYKTKLKTSLDAHRKTPTTESLQEAYSAVDKATKKHLVHPNRAARIKSQLAKLVKLVQPAATPKKKTTPASKTKKTTSKATIKKSATKPSKSKAASKKA